MRDIRVPRLNCLLLFPSLFDTYYTAVVDAEWQDWGQWSQCSVSCGQGSQLRARACSGALFGGNDQCSGDSTDARDCKISECEGIVMPFIIPCLSPILIIRSSALCFLFFLNILAAVNAEWQEWGQWSECSASCGQGSKHRARACSGAFFGGDQNCPGYSTEAGVCKIAECKGMLVSGHFLFIHEFSCSYRF